MGVGKVPLPLRGEGRERVIKSTAVNFGC